MTDEQNSATNEDPIRLQCIVVDIDTDPAQHYYRFAFKDLTGAERSVEILCGEVMQPQQVLSRLVSAGMPPRPLAEMRAYLVKACTEDVPVTHITSVSGWHRRSYVGHRRSFGAPGETPPTFRARANDNYAPLMVSAGSAAAWREGLRVPCTRSDFLTFSLALAYAAPLMSLVGDTEGMILQLEGESSTGKTLCARACQSNFGAGDRLPTFDATHRGVEELCAARSDLVTIIDEQGRTLGDEKATGQFLKALAFMVAGGAGRARSAAVNASTPNLRWRTIGLSTAEVPLGKRIRGQEVRQIAIKIPPATKGGIFNRMREGESSIQLAMMVHDVITANFGLALDDYIGKVVLTPEDIRDEAARLREHFIELIAPASSADRRIASKFGLVYAGAIIGCRLGATPWTKEVTGGNAVLRLCRRVLRSGFNAKAAVRDLIRDLEQEQKAGKLPKVVKGHSLPEGAMDNLGFRRELPTHGPCVVLFADKLQARWPQESEFRAVIAELKRRGLLITMPNAKVDTVQLQVQGLATRAYHYVLDARVLRKKKAVPAMTVSKTKATAKTKKAETAI